MSTTKNRSRSLREWIAFLTESSHMRCQIKKPSLWSRRPTKIWNGTIRAKSWDSVTLKCLQDPWRFENPNSTTTTTWDRRLKRTNRLNNHFYSSFWLSARLSSMLYAMANCIVEEIATIVKKIDDMEALRCK